MIGVRYLGRPKGDVVRAEARVVRAGRQLIVVETRVLDQEERIIATGDFSSMLVPRRAPLLPETEASDPSGPEL
jgi:acyl-coenzyme A thioesterase PaaI-like protein